ncbi:MAG: hypothetical protein U0411_09125 [Thermodesulfovibrionales bacterium]
MVNLQITMRIAAGDRAAAAAVYNKYKQRFLQEVPGTASKDLLVREEDVQVAHVFDSEEHAKGYLNSDLFTKEVVKALEPLLQDAPDILLYETV